jgi:CrcB protein
MVADLEAQIVMLAMVLVFIGGMLGTVWRFWLSGLIARRFGETFPFGTLTVNIVASVFLGLLSGFLAHMADRQLATALQQLVAIGVCGGLSTFSSFSLQTWNLLLERRWLVAILNMLVSTALCYAGVVLGWQITG